MPLDIPWINEAKKELGTKEFSGSLNNPKIVSFWKDARLSWILDDATPWCAGFANAMLERAGYKGTRKANARSFLNWGINLNNGFRSDPYYGSIIVFNRPPSLWNGHVGFLVAHDQNHVLVIGGNQGDKVSYAKFPKSRVIGVRMPEEAYMKFCVPQNMIAKVQNLSGKISENEA